MEDISDWLSRKNGLYLLRKASLIDYTDKNELYLLKKASLIAYSGKNEL